MTTNGANGMSLTKQIRNNIMQVVEVSDKSDLKLPVLFEAPIDPLFILGWLEYSPENCKLYWLGRDSEFEFGGTGVGFDVDYNRPNSMSAEEIIKAVPFGEQLIFFCGNSFSGYKSIDAGWQSFPSRVSIIPEVMVVRRGESYCLKYCLTVSPGDKIDDVADRAEKLMSNYPNVEGAIDENPFSELESICHHPDYDGWSESIAISLARITSGEIKKIVLARRTDICLKKEPRPVAILSRLTKENRNCYAIMYQPSPGAAFISLSPERLFCLTDLRLETEAISSTVMRGKNEDDDLRLEKELVGSNKQKREHRYVVEGLGRAMLAISETDPTVGATEVLKLNRIQHLLTPVGGKLKKGLSGSDVVGALHPTAAVGGTPKIRAVPMIAELEPFDRGWYAAPIGYVTKGKSEFAVGIRSALIHKNIISVFSGAGIVRGSSADAEWNEIESKNIFKSLLPEEVKV